MHGGSWPRILAAAILLLAAGCNEAEDFTVRVKRPPVAVIAPLTAIDLSEAKAVFPKMRVERSRPSDLEVLYTIPSSAGPDSTIRLRLEPVENGSATVVHATIAVPDMRVDFEGGLKQLNERKVERSFRRLLTETGQSLEMGSSGAQASAKLSQLLSSLAIVTNEPFLRRALALNNAPGGMGGMLGDDPKSEPDFYAPRDENVPENISRPMDDPDQPAMADEYARARAGWREQEVLDRASAPMDNPEMD